MVPNYEQNTSFKNLRKKRLYLFGFIILCIVLAVISAFQYVKEQDGLTDKKVSVEEYFLEKEKVFAGQLGLNNVDTFPEVKEAKQIAENTSESIRTDEINKAKEEIANLLRTPTMLVKAYNDLQASDEASYLALMEDLEKFHFSLSEFLHNLWTKDVFQNKTVHEMKEIRNALMEGRSSGIDAVDKMIRTLESQGYMVASVSDGGISVVQNFKWLLDEIENWEHLPGDKALFQFMAENSGSMSLFIDEMETFQMEDIFSDLLELEAIHHTYQGDSISSKAADILSWRATELLNFYLLGDVEKERKKEELEWFLASHKDSVYWSIVNKAVQEYRKVDWEHLDYYVFDELSIMMDEEFEDVQVGDITRTDNWPLMRRTIEDFKRFAEENEKAFLLELSPLEVVSLYLYSIERGEIDHAIQLYDHSIIEQGTESLRQELLMQSESHFWNNQYSTLSYLVKQREGKEATISFLQREENEVSMVFMLQETVEGWKLVDITAK
ncbi:hypothetical protein [Oceanobacillus kapialis]|uniref:hypothetical protein n=1 Tax=Oceanobacillus kapialis TaxID=481353 RepID=UPI00384D0D2D